MWRLRKNRMKKTITTFLTFMIINISVFAQQNIWAEAPFATVFAMTIDNAGNTFLTGNFPSGGNNYDFDPGPGTAYLNDLLNGNAFIAKYDSAGHYVWAKSFGASAEPFSIAVDAADNVIITGQLTVSADFDPSAATAILSGTNKLFLAKYDSNGNYLWAGIQQGWGHGKGTSLKTDASNNIYVTGTFSSDSADFNMGSGVANLYAPSSGSPRMFVAKYDPNGAYIWAHSMDSPSTSSSVVSPVKIDLDATGNIVVAGSFNGSIDFNISATISYASSAGFDDIFMAKFDNSCNLLWVERIGAASYDDLNSMSLDGSGNIVLVGSFINTVDFNPGVGTANIAGGTGGSNFIAKYSSTGAYLWAEKISSSPAASFYGVATDGNGNVVTTGSFTGTVDFDPSSGVSTLVSTSTGVSPSDDVFLAEYSSGGSYLWAFKIGYSGSDVGKFIYVDGGNNIFTSGYASGFAMPYNLDFQPGVDSNIVTMSNSQAYYLAKYFGPIVTVGVAETQNENGITIYPNPFTSKTTIDFNEEQKNIIIRIVDMLGKEIATINFTGRQYVIEKENMKAGIYFVMITDEKKNVVNRKIIIE